MGKAEGYTYAAWRPCTGRYEVCRRQGCSAPAVVETLGLCEGHLLEYRSGQAALLAEVEARSQARARAR